MPDDLVNVRYMVSDVQESIDFYTQHFGFQLGRSMPDGRRPEPGGWNRIHSSWGTSTTRWRGCALPAWRFATRSSPDPADSRS